MADLGIIFLQEKTHHSLIPVIIYNGYRKYAVGRWIFGADPIIDDYFVSALASSKNNEFQGVHLIFYPILFIN